MEQLDLVGRTGETARAFGIDFLAVLHRGSQYRVESLMARLAHSQNYLLPSPSKEQVCSFWPRLKVQGNDNTLPAWTGGIDTMETQSVVSI